MNEPTEQTKRSNKLQNSRLIGRVSFLDPCTVIAANLIDMAARVQCFSAVYSARCPHGVATIDTYRDVTSRKCGGEGNSSCSGGTHTKE